MEKQQLRCPKCQKITEVNKEKLRPYSGQKVTITCGETSCKCKFQITVPAFAPPPPDSKYEPTYVEPKSGSSVSEDNKGTDKQAKILSARLSVLKNDKTAPQSFVLHEGINIIGRLSKHAGDYVPDIKIVTNDTFISKKHCQITMVKNRNNGIDCILKDAGSANGTYLNNTKLSKEDEIFLGDADTILIGDTNITFELK